MAGFLRSTGRARIDIEKHHLTPIMKTSPRNRSHAAVWLAFAFGLANFPNHANAAIIMQDDFSGNSLDSSKWFQFNTYAWGNSSLVVDNGTATFNYRPIIRTTQSFSGPIQINGSFSLGDDAQSESLLFVTRSDGSVHGGSMEPAGLRFRFNNSGMDLQFLDYSGGWTDIAGPTSFAFNNNQVYSFSIIDAGDEASVSIDGNLVFTTSVAPNLGEGQGYFSIANRERAAGTQVGPITISSTSAVPETSTSFGLLALGAGGLLTRRRLKRAAWAV